MSKKVNLKIPMDELAIVDYNLKRVIEKGTFKIIVGDGQYLEKEFEVI